MKNNCKVPNLGIGIGLRPAHYREIFASWPAIDWFEIISENFMFGQKKALSNLMRILERYPIVQHGVNLCIGSKDPLDFDYLKKLKELAKLTKTPWISDHLSWGRAPNANFHELLPLPFRKDVADFVAEKARIVQDFLELPFALENLSTYASFTCDEMSEWDFYSRVVEKGNIYMMLDINNVYVSAQNNGFSPTEYLSELPLNRVLQIHLAGHTDCGTHLLDTHDQPVCDEVWKLYGAVYPKTGGVSTLLEWDDNFLPLQDTLNEALKAKAFQREIAYPC